MACLLRVSQRPLLQPRLQYPVKISFKNESKKMHLSDEQRMMACTTNTLTFQEIVMVNSLCRREMTSDVNLDLHKEIGAHE